MTRFRRLIPLVLAAFAAVSLSVGPLQADERRITVVGEGGVSAAPDMAMIQIGVSEEAPTAAEALRAMSAAGESILARLTEAGVESRDIQTSGLTLRPRYQSRVDREAPEITGFVAETRFGVSVRDLAGLGTILDSVVTEGGANTLQSVEFTLSDLRPMRDAARRDAVADGRAKAELFAEAAGVTLGALLTLNEDSGGFVPAPMMEMRMMDAASGSVPVAEGEVTIEVRVTMVYAIAQ
ncbi:SIMPL domain-containing protein [Ponticoccus sp. SC2-23]|uniref:SIMPL domain-containing protein n=1 Tax=Alexandriicola marinus TaxID=2081710 RepID=UPI000FD9D4F9|nr:SIMPL domain-containing protein [Alexandriicola marinus]MBM1220848.1 SIMPL domain-containing protein [Ponticoccus sp. SC6-9]MBM1225418.1 SIMPL domain-containing protein [Ponticoccus sp. SC6-15]MBM1227601.1 SIMPL domain-containing protein [Ponticoccus sp. SC6-38]MBM1234761.1 SIMPL domain-containing protein [Ponticoccus sp. SC6-45]MBM1238103.1 SIMPL domain-containing protein [Ponticoccus sp. SC6-49]MBM1244264.1 SIMPL domain-containing protein [Ponticoccus sp. SC2-64]MBM1248285.1 SIMPL domai